MVMDGLPLVSQEAGWQILTTLAIIQASIFAIVFSVVILGVRLSANRYSPRLADVFKSDDAYKRTVSIFAVSIGFDVASLYSLEFTASEVRFGFLVAAGLFALVSSLMLYSFINGVLEKTTPEGMLKTLDGILSPQWIRYRAEASKKEATERDPFVTITSVITSTISERDREAASLGLDILGNSVATSLKELPQREFEEDTALDNSLRDLCVERVPNLTYEASDEDLTKIATEDLPDTVKTIGDAAIKEDLERVIGHLAEGQGSLITGLGFGIEEERVRKRLMRNTRELIKEAAEQHLWGAVVNGNIHLGWRSAGSVTDRRKEELSPTLREYDSLLLLHYPKVIGIAGDSGEDVNDYRPSDWGLIFSDVDRFDSRPIESAIASCYDAMAELTSALIRFEIREEVQIVDWSNIAVAWREGFENLPDELHSLRQLWFGTILYLKYLDFVTGSEVMNNFLAILPRKISSDFKNSTVERILEGQINPRGKMDLIPGRVNPLGAPRTGYRSPPVPDPEIEFKEWLKEFQVY